MRPAVAVQVQLEVADVDDDLAAEGVEDVAADDAVDLESVLGLQLAHGLLGGGVVAAGLLARVDAGADELALQLLDVLALGARPQGRGAEVLGAVDDEVLLAGDDVAALVLDRDDDGVLALSQVLGGVLGLGGGAVELPLLAVQDELDGRHAELVGGLDAHGEAQPCSSVLSSWVILSTGGCASTYTSSRLARVLPARSAVVMTTVDSPFGRSTLTVYLPAASASPLALTSPAATVTVACGSVSPLKVAGSVLMRPSSTLAARTSVGMLVSTVKRQSLLTSRRNTLELVALNVTGARRRRGRWC